MSPRSVNRRIFLRGTGNLLIALPCAQFAWSEGRLIAAPEGDAPRRLFTVSWPNGVDPNKMTFDNILKPLSSLQSEIAVIKNMSNRAGYDGAIAEGHQCGAGAAFTGTPTRVVNGVHVTGSATIDQAAYEYFKPGPQFRPVQTGFTTFGHSLGGFSKLLDYRSCNSEGEFAEAFNDPYKIFTKLFGSVTHNNQIAASVQLRQKSILDGVVSQMKEFSSDRYGLPAESKSQLKDHLEKMRELELAATKMITGGCKSISPMDPKAAMELATNHDRVEELLDLISEILVTGVQCDIVRYGNFSIGEGALHFFNKVLMGPHQIQGHETAHYDPGNAKFPFYGETWDGFNRFYMARVSTLVSKFQMARDSDGRSLLDNSLFYMASDMSHQANPMEGHSRNPSLSLVIGGKVHGVPGGQIMDAMGRPTADALAATLNAAGVPVTKLGPLGTGRLF